MNPLKFIICFELEILEIFFFKLSPTLKCIADFWFQHFVTCLRKQKIFHFVYFGDLIRV